MSFAEELKRLDHLHGQLRGIEIKISEMPENDPKRAEAEHLRRGLVFQIRSMLSGGTIDPCSDPDCVDAGTVTSGGKQWCPSHAPTASSS